jgi:hypothetical protein
MRKESLDLIGLGQFMKPVGKSVSVLLEDFLRPPAQAAGELVRNQIQWWNFQNVTSKIKRAKELIDSEGLSESDLPPSVYLPWIKASADVDDPELSEMWARLLASAYASSDARQPIFIETLKRLSAADARLLEKISVEHADAYHWLPRDPRQSGPLALSSATLIATDLLTRAVSSCNSPRKEDAGEIRLREQRFRECYDLLPEKDTFQTYVISPLGWQFLRAVRPSPSSSPNK